MGDPKIGPFGEGIGKFQFLVTYVESDPKVLCKIIKVTKLASNQDNQGINSFSNPSIGTKNEIQTE